MPAWPRELLAFDAGDWPGDEWDAVRAWSAAREAYAGSHGHEFVYTLIGGRVYRRYAFLDGIMNDPRERQHTWDVPA